MQTPATTGVAAGVFCNGGEGGNKRLGVFITSGSVSVTTQLVRWLLVAAFWLMVVVCGCFGKVGNGISTKSAQTGLLTASVLMTAVPEGREARRRRKRLEASQNDSSASETAASYSRFSSDQQREESITQQQSEARKKAEANGYDLRIDLQFADEAISGTKRERAGLNEMLRAAEAGEFRVLYLYSISRLARESVITMPLLKRLVHTHGIRIISVTEGLDSAVAGWEVLATVLSLVSERFIKELSDSVFRGQQGSLSDGYSVGDWCFGYKSEPVDGAVSVIRRRGAKPRMRYVIDVEEADWVRKIFRWFVVDRQSITWIVKRLNQLNAPKDHRSSTPHWQHALVVRLLSRPKYIGIWTWGLNRNVRDPETGLIRQEFRSDAEVAAWVRSLPELQIIDVETFHRAQELLDENEKKFAPRRDNKGKLRGSTRTSEGGHPRHLLSGLIKCGNCGQNFVAGGTKNKYMFCPAYRRDTCNCRTQLHRGLAERLILDAIGRRMLGSTEWTQAVIDAAGNAWRERHARIPGELAAVRQQIVDAERKRERLLDQIESGVEIPDLTARLERRSSEIRELREKETSLLRSGKQSDTPPSEEWLREQLSQLGAVLKEKTPAAAYAIRDLVGGAIRVHEVGRTGRHRRILRATFTLQATSLASSLGLAVTASDDAPTCGEQIEIEMVDPDICHRAIEARRLYDQGLPNKEIAKQMGVTRSRVTALLKESFGSSGETMPDGRSRRWAPKLNENSPHIPQDREKGTGESAY